MCLQEKLKLLWCDSVSESLLASLHSSMCLARLHWSDPPMSLLAEWNMAGLQWTAPLAATPPVFKDHLLRLLTYDATICKQACWLPCGGSRPLPASSPGRGWSWHQCGHAHHRCVHASIYKQTCVCAPSETWRARTHTQTKKTCIVQLGKQTDIAMDKDIKYTQTKTGRQTEISRDICTCLIQAHQTVQNWGGGTSTPKTALAKPPRVALWVGGPCHDGALDPALLKRSHSPPQESFYKTSLLLLRRLKGLLKTCLAKVKGKSSDLGGGGLEQSQGDNGAVGPHCA